MMVVSACTPTLHLQLLGVGCWVPVGTHRDEPELDKRQWTCGMGLQRLMQGKKILIGD